MGSGSASGECTDECHWAVSVVVLGRVVGILNDQGPSCDTLSSSFKFNFKFNFKEHVA